MLNKWLLLGIISIGSVVFSPLIYSQTTFQKIYKGEADVECFGAYQTTDDGYIFTGVATVGGINRIFLTRTDCHGEILWNNTYSSTSTWNNISQRVIETQDHGFLLAASIGSFSAYNILLVRTNASGAAQWMKVMQGSGDDGVNSVIETSSQDFIIAGSTSTYGQDAGSFYKDIYLMKVSHDGNLIWGKTYGTAATYDEAFDVLETFDGHYLSTGRYIEQGTFQCFLLKTDTSGAVVFMKTFGDTLQETTGYAVANTLDGGYVITGSSTLNKTSFQDYPDEFLIKTNSDGDTLWCRSYHGMNPDGSENGSSVVVTPDGSYAIGVATFSYPSVGFVPNKHCVLKTDEEGHMEYCRAYNQGGSHYPYLTASKGGDGYVLSGFSNFYTPNFSAMIIKLDSAFTSGCNETDETSLTVEEHMPAIIHEPPVFLGSGGSLVTTTTVAVLNLTDTTLCFNSADSCFVFTALNDLITDYTGRLNLFPNPAIDHFFAQINLDANEPAIVQLFNEEGAMVHSQIVLGHRSTNYFFVPVSDLSGGTYLVKIMNTNICVIGKLILGR